MTPEREVKKETDFWGNENEVVYENGQKVGELRFEERGGFFGIGAETVKVEYDTGGNERGYARQEERGGFLGLGAEEVEVRYDSDDNELSHSRVEERGGILGLGSHHVRVEYDNDRNEVSQTNWEKRGGILGFGGERVRVTRHSGALSQAFRSRDRASTGASVSRSARTSKLESRLKTIITAAIVLLYITSVIVAFSENPIDGVVVLFGQGIGAIVLILVMTWIVGIVFRLARRS